MNKNPEKTYPTIGCCGLDCGLCPRFHTASSSKCPGCCGPNFFNKHPSCSYITCCVKKKNLEVCAQCDEFPCSKFGSLLEGVPKYDSFLTYKKVPFNLDYIRKYGIEKFIEEQKERIELLDLMLKNFDDGRSKSFFCIIATLLPIKILKTILDEIEQKLKTNQINSNDLKGISKILKEKCNNFAEKEGIELKLRTKGKK